MAVHFEEGTEKSSTNHWLFVQNKKAAILDLGYAFTHIMSECMTEAQASHTEFARAVCFF